MKLRALISAILITFISIFACPKVSSSQNIEQQSKKEFEIQAIAQVQDQYQEPPIQEKVKVTGMEEEKVKSFFGAIQTAVKQKDLFALSRMVQYPLMLRNLKGDQVKVHSSKEFIGNYCNFANSNWQRAVMRQKYEQLFSN